MKKVFCDRCTAELDLKDRPPEKFDIHTSAPARLWSISINASLAIKDGQRRSEVGEATWDKKGPVDLCPECLVALFRVFADAEKEAHGDDTSAAQ